MIKFEMIGIQHQEMSVSREDCTSKFSYSCKLCNRGIRLNCDMCAIKVTHELMITVFEDLVNYRLMKAQAKIAATREVE